METLSNADPAWLAIGLLLFVVGVMLVLWSSRRNVSGEMAASAKQAAFNALTKSGSRAEARANASKRAANSARRDIARFVGVVGFALAISGLLVAALGVFAS